MTIERALPKRGEIWRVNFDPTVGAAIRKTRPAMVISSDSLGRLPLKLITRLGQVSPGVVAEVVAAVAAVVEYEVELADD